MINLRSAITAIAHPNIALVKYWGKRDSELMLPLNSSISMTLSGVRTITTIEKSDQDSLKLNNQEISKNSPEYQAYTKKYLNKLRNIFPQITAIKITSENNFPTGAGIASSASGFAALALAINKLFQLELNTEEVSRMARLGSGSATRSILGGFNYWLMGQEKSGEDSSIKQIATANHWPELRLAIAITATEKKSVSSRAGMTATVNTSPEYQSLWLDTVQQDLAVMEQAILERNFSLLGQTAESSALKMHQTMRSTIPPIDYFNQGTIKIIDKIQSTRNLTNSNDYLESYFTIDAGPQVKILYLAKDQYKVDQLLQGIPEIKEIIYCEIGEDARIINN